MTHTKRILFALLAVVTITVVTSTNRSTLAAVRDDGPIIVETIVHEIDRMFTDGDGPAVRLDRRVTIRGQNFFGTAFGPDVTFALTDGRIVTAPMVILRNSETIEAFAPPGIRGTVLIEVENPDHRRATHAADL